MLSRFDIVGFDPRGVGLSTPVECISDDMKEQLVAAEPRPTTDAQLDDAFALTKQVADGCAKEYGDALGTFNTVDTARDMERLRQALGDDEADLPRLLVRHDARLHLRRAVPGQGARARPRRRGRPRHRPEADAEASAKAFEAGFDAFAANCVGLIAGCPVGAEPAPVRRATCWPRPRTTPIPSSAARARRAQATPGRHHDRGPGRALRHRVLAAAGAGRWPRRRKGDAEGLFSLADSYSGPAQGRHLLEPLRREPRDQLRGHRQEVHESEIRGLAADWGQKYPLFGAGSAVSLYTCSVWKAHRTPLPERDAAGSAPILVVGNTGDPVTPLPGAQDMAKDLQNGDLLVWQGHGAHRLPEDRRASPPRWTPT